MNNEDLLKIEPDETSVDSDGIIENNDLIIKKDESYRKAKNHNILSHKEIKELTAFFLKQSPINILEKLDGIRAHVHKLEYNGFNNDLNTLDQLKKYVRTKIRSSQSIKDMRRKTILKSIIFISQKMALHRRLSVNQSYSSLWD